MKTKFTQPTRKAPTQTHWQGKRTFMRTLACILALVLSFGLFAVIPPTADAAQSAAAYGVATSCGHDDTSQGDHNPADCGVPGHYNCDGETHDMMQCWMDYLAGGGFPGGFPGIPGGTTGDEPPGGGDDEPPGGGGDPPIETPPDEQPQPPRRPPIPPDMEPPEKPPIEIEIPDDGSDLDLEFDEEKMRELAPRAVWSIAFYECFDSAPQASFPVINLDAHLPFFEVTALGGDDIFGFYSGSGYLTFSNDVSFLVNMVNSIPYAHMEAEYMFVGPLMDVDFRLLNLDALDDDDIVGPLFDPDGDDTDVVYPLSPDDNLLPLVPPGMEARRIAYARGTMIWQHYTVVDRSEYWVYPAGFHLLQELDFAGDIELIYHIYVFDSGVAKLYISGLGATRLHAFYGTVSRRIDPSSLR